MKASSTELLEVLKDAEEFIDRHSKKWYTSGQELLARVRAAIAKAKDHKWEATTLQPIATAPMDGTHVLLFYEIDGEIRKIDHGCWEFLETSDSDGTAIYYWITINGSDMEWTHWAPFAFDEPAEVQP